MQGHDPIMTYPAVVESLRAWLPHFGQRPLSDEDVAHLFAAAEVPEPVSVPLTGSSRGFVTRGPGRPRVVIDSDLEGSRRRFVLLHELAHVVAGHLAKPAGTDDLGQEILCDAIALTGVVGADDCDPVDPEPVMRVFLAAWRDDEEGDARFRLWMAQGLVAMASHGVLGDSARKEAEEAHNG